MIYLIGILGFIGGFIFGQMVLYFMLRHKKREELLNDPYIKWTYGTVNWVFAGLGSYGFVLLYREYFPAPLPLN
jgi:ABC-type antimicrobial peptide transport system permease subunit